MILYQNEDFYVLKKRAGIDFHDQGRIQGFFNQAKEKLNESELFPIHRLDKDTSGLILVARNKKSASEFQTLFNRQKIGKYYLAISDRKPRKKQGWIRGGMERSRRKTWKLTRDKNHFAVTRFISRPFEEKYFFLLRLYTGKTHQARVALRSLSAPVLGDPIYESGEKNNSDRMYLHAFALCFEWKGQHFSFSLPPEDGIWFQKANHGFLETWAKPWTWI